MSSPSSSPSSIASSAPERITLGRCPCPLCGIESEVRKFANGKRKGQLYVVCPVHRQSMNPGKDFQEWILNNARMADADGTLPPPKPAVPAAPEPATSPDVPASPPSAPEPAQVRARGGFFPLIGF